MRLIWLLLCVALVCTVEGHYTEDSWVEPDDVSQVGAPAESWASTEVAYGDDAYRGGDLKLVGAGEFKSKTHKAKKKAKKAKKKAKKAAKKAKHAHGKKAAKKLKKAAKKLKKKAKKPKKKAKKLKKKAKKA